MPATSSNPPNNRHPRRVGVAMIVQESNTFSPAQSDLDSFASQGLWIGQDAATQSASTNTEFAGAVTALTEAGYTAVPLVRAWAMSGGVLNQAAFEELARILAETISEAGPLDGLVLALHGALVSDLHADADACLVDVAKRSLGAGVPIVVSLDLHANVTQRLTESVDALVGFRTYPHVDQGETGARAARLLVHILDGGTTVTHLVKLPMLLPPEAQGTASDPMRALRTRADSWMENDDIHDVSLFPVQLWLDIPELGFAVTVVANTDRRAAAAARDVSRHCWVARHDFRVDLITATDAIDRALQHETGRPAVLVHSSDSPTSGCTADSPAVLAHIEASSRAFVSALTLVDASAVTKCASIPVGAHVVLDVGASLNPTWDSPVRITGQIHARGTAPISLTGPSMTGQEVSIGGWCVVRTLRHTYVLLTERPAPTFDPATWAATSIPWEDLDIVSVRSANLFRAGYGDLIGPTFLLDLPGASTPNLHHLNFTRGGQHNFPYEDREVTT